MTHPPEGGEAAFLHSSPFRYLKQVERRVSIVKMLVGDAWPASVIDLGCGDGRLSLQFLSADSMVTLVDTSPMMLEHASSNIPDHYRERVRLVERAIAGVEGPAQYDLVLAAGVLAHVTDLTGTLAKITTLVSPRGLAIIQLTDAATPLGAAIWSWSRLMSRRRGYRLNRLTEGLVRRAMEGGDLRLCRRVRCSPLYGRKSVRHDARTGARWGAEKFLLFRRIG